MSDPAILFSLNSLPCLVTPTNLSVFDKCRGCSKNSETFIMIDCEIFNLCKECSKKICVRCPNKTSHAFDKLRHICTDCKNDKKNRVYW